MITWMVTVGIELSSPFIECRIVWSQLAWIGIILLPTFWSFFLYEYTFSRPVPRFVVRLILFFMPVLFVPLILTNAFHGMMYGPETRLIQGKTGLIAHFDHGPLFFVVVSYLYLLILGSSVIAGLAMVKANPAIRSFFVKIFLTTVIPAIANVSYVFYDVTWFNTDPTPFSFAASLTLIVWLIADNRWVDVGAIARDMLFYKTTDVVLVVDLDGKLLEANGAADDVLKSGRGTSVCDLEGFGPIIKKLLKTQTLPDLPEVTNGDRHYVARAHQIRLGVGQRLLGWTVSFVDVTIQKRAAERALAAERVQTQFLATVSHELRTPLTVVNGALGLLKGQMASLPVEKADRLVDLATKNSNILASLLNDLLDTQKLSSSEFTLNCTTSNIDDIVLGAVDSMETFNSARNIVVRYEASPRAIFAQMDENRIHQVLTNVLSNAFKFSKPDSFVNVEVTERGGLAFISIEDTGRGIPAGSEDKVFGRFSQVDESDQKDIYGSGLGMHIAKQIMSQHGGSISYVSEVGEGTTFTITLPIACYDAKVA